MLACKTAVEILTTVESSFYLYFNFSAFLNNTCPGNTIKL